MKKAQDENTKKKNHLILFFTIILLIAVAVFTFYQYKNSKLFTNSDGGADIKNHQEGDVDSESAVNKSKETDNDDISSSQDPVKKAEDESVSKKQYNSSILKIQPTDVVLGNKNAKVVIVEYASLSCPHCASFHQESFGKIKEKYIDTGKIMFIYRDFILNQQSLVATLLLRCYAEKYKSNIEKYHNLIKILFRTQDSWAFNQNFRDNLKSIAVLDGFNEENFNKCLANEQLQQDVINKFIEAKKSLDLESAPTFFINNEKVVGYSDYPSFEEIIEKHLKK
jgi:protein-disulfide isomerase